MSDIKNATLLVGKKLNQLRNNKGLTQEDLAYKAGLNRAYVGYIERGERNPSTETLAKIAKALRTSLKDLL